MTMRIGMVPEVRLTGSEDWWSVCWDCPDHPTCGYQRTFDTEAKASAFVARIKAEGCPNAPWFHDEDQYPHRTENRDAS